MSTRLLAQTFVWAMNEADKNEKEVNLVKAYDEAVNIHGVEAVREAWTLACHLYDAQHQNTEDLFPTPEVSANRLIYNRIARALGGREHRVNGTTLYTSSCFHGNHGVVRYVPETDTVLYHRGKFQWRRGPRDDWGGIILAGAPGKKDWENLTEALRVTP